jgi:ribosomal protein S18 acetylase RimI-like enzyme
MEKVIIRPASSADLAILRNFEQGVITAERPFDTTLKNSAIQYYDLEEMLIADHILLVVAEIEGQLVGSGYARIQTAKPYLQHERYAYLGFMYVDNEHRGKGINQKIMETLKAWATTHQISELRLEVYAENLSAIKAYEKVGFQKHMIEMRINLDE